MAHQEKLMEEKDDFVESLNLTPEKIREDLEKMRDVEGFPIGDVEDILELSEPPYYTAYPNPYLKDFIEMYGTPYDEETDDYDVEPFVGDVSEGKTDALYKAHSYHSKIPHKAIMHYIDHYTEQGDIVFDCFCGSGMTGVAAQMTNRTSILLDLSPAASFISYNYSYPLDPKIFYSEAMEILNQVNEEYGWMFETNHSNNALNPKMGQKDPDFESNKNIKGKINYVVWSDVFSCPHCGSEYVFFEEAFDFNTKKFKKEFHCPNCKVILTKKDSKLVFDKIYDSLLKKEIKKAKEVPVLINYTLAKNKFEKKPDAYDLKLIDQLNSYPIPYWYPLKEIPDGHNTEQPKKSHAINYLHQFYSHRQIVFLARVFELLSKSGKNKNYLCYTFEQAILGMAKINRYAPTHFSQVNRYLSGTLYVSSLRSETSLVYIMENKIKRLRSVLTLVKDSFDNKTITSTQSATDLNNIPDNSVDYIFTDPPFGDSVNYLELNFLWESWLKVLANNENEVIINKSQHKSLTEFRNLILNSFKNSFKKLKPNRWITLVFHNSKAEVWNVIQKSLVEAGFIIAQVATMDRGSKSFKQITSPNAVKNDLIINAYKPSESFTKCFVHKAGLNMEQDFIEMHLNKLPVEPNLERTQQMLYSKLLAQYIQNGFEVRMDASEFYEMLRANFEEMDGYWFLTEQIPQYEKTLKLKFKLEDMDLTQTVLGIDDEKSAIIWLAQFLQTPKTYDEIYIEFSKSLLTSQDRMPELKTILDENFSTSGGKYVLPSDLERKEKETIREKHLNKEFQEIISQAQSKKKIKELRKEALLHGLMKLYKERDVDTINLLGKKIDRKIIDSDDDISAIIDWAEYQ